jgi:hypothetical protein
MDAERFIADVVEKYDAFLAAVYREIFAGRLDTAGWPTRDMAAAEEEC